ncbi:MAG: hypothetical protein FRX49_05148 [Trebouxia sp. A1-2]|nr:MAG: hypothetical protein FRX49_05148 [Trebouxia sp. A1-2]
MHNAEQDEKAGQTGTSSLRLTGAQAVPDRVPHHVPSQVKGSSGARQTLQQNILSAVTLLSQDCSDIAASQRSSLPECDIEDHEQNLSTEPTDAEPLAVVAHLEPATGLKDKVMLYETNMQQRLLDVGTTDHSLRKIPGHVAHKGARLSCATLAEGGQQEASNAARQTRLQFEQEHEQRLTSCHHAHQARVAIADARTAELQADVRCRMVEVADAACQTESNHHLSSSGNSTAPAVDSASGSAPESALHTMPVSAATLLSGSVLNSAADCSSAGCSSADCATSGAPSSMVQISVGARGCTLAGTAGLQPSQQPSTAVIQPENGSTAESASLREPGAASDSAGIAAGANNPSAACSFLLEKQASADVVEALLQPSRHVDSSTSAQTEAQSVIAGANTAAADNQKLSHRRNLVAFISLHVTSRLLRVMHRHRQPMKPVASSQVPGRAAGKLSNAKISSTCREQQQHWTVMTEAAGPSRSAALGGTQSASEPSPLHGETSMAGNAAAVRQCDGEAMPTQTGIVPTHGGVVPTCACMAGMGVAGVAATTLHQLALATKVAQLEADKQRLQGQVWEALSLADRGVKSFKKAHQKVLQQRSTITMLKRCWESSHDLFQQQQDKCKEFLHGLKAVHDQWEEDVLGFVRRVFDHVTPAPEVRCPKDMEELVWQDVHEIIRRWGPQRSRAYLKQLLCTWHEDKNRQVMKGTHKVISQILIEGLKQC